MLNPAALFGNLDTPPSAEADPASLSGTGGTPQMPALQPTLLLEILIYVSAYSALNELSKVTNLELVGLGPLRTRKGTDLRLGKAGEGATPLHGITANARLEREGGTERGSLSCIFTPVSLCESESLMMLTDSKSHSSNAPQYCSSTALFVGWHKAEKKGKGMNQISILASPFRAI